MSASASSAKLQIAAALVALLAISGVIIRSSSAAFSGTATNTGNAFETGSLALTSDAATAMFNVQNMVPGQTVTRCVTVTYEGSIADPGPVKLYSAGYTDSGTLGDHLLITIDEGSGATDVNCAGFAAGSTARSEVTLNTFNTNHGVFANGVGAWDPSSTPESTSYRFTVKLDSATPDAQEGASVTNFGLTWELQAGS